MSRDVPKELLLIQAYSAFVDEVAKVGACERAQVACVLTPPDLSTVVAIGYNGPAAGLPNHCARPKFEGACGCVHAEANAVIKAPPGPKWAFLTIFPCESCAGMLVNAGVEVVVYNREPHREGLTAGLELLDKLGIAHGYPDTIVQSILSITTDEPESDSRVLGQGEWTAEDYAVAKGQTSRFTDG